MAYFVSQTFKDNIRDTNASKICLAMFDDGTFFSNDDFTEDGVRIKQYYNTSDDLCWGDCPSDTLNFSVIANGTLSGYNFGKCRMYMGVMTSSGDYEFGHNVNAYIEMNLVSYEAQKFGLLRKVGLGQWSQIDSGSYLSLIGDGTTGKVYAIGENSAVEIDNSTGVVTPYIPSRFMAMKARDEISIVLAPYASPHTVQIWYKNGLKANTYESFEVVPCGVYNVNKPRTTNGIVVSIQDAYDNMTLLDRDATQFVESLSYPVTLGGIYEALCNYVGVSYVSSTFPYSDVVYSDSPFKDNSFSLRDILWWISERARRVAHFNRTGVLDLIDIGTLQETIDASNISQDGYSIAEYKTNSVTGVLVRGSDGSTKAYGDISNPYVISSNPFIQTITNEDLQEYWKIPTFYPIECYVLEADPSIDVGDLVDIKPDPEDVVAIANIYSEAAVQFFSFQNESGNALSNQNGTILAEPGMYAIQSPTYRTPLMQRELVFIGGIRATYTATGNEYRKDDITHEEYNASVNGGGNTPSGSDHYISVYGEDGERAVIDPTEGIRFNSQFAVQTGFMSKKHGTVVNGGSGEVSVPSGTWTTVGTIYDIPEDGTKLLSVRGSFEPNATGYRRIIVTNDESSQSAITNVAGITLQSASGIATNVPIYFAYSGSENTLYIRAYQNSGSALSTSAYWNYTVL